MAGPHSGRARPGDTGYPVRSRFPNWRMTCRSDEVPATHAHPADRRRPTRRRRARISTAAPATADLVFAERRMAVRDRLRRNCAIPTSACSGRERSGCRSHPRQLRAVSGIPGFYRACWYRRMFQLPRLEAQDRWLLHFGAVDTSATVWVNERCVGAHEGGYTPFAFDITDLVADGSCEIVVRAVR